MSKRLVSTIITIAMIQLLMPIMSPGAETTIHIGDYVQMGSYYGERILWRCVDIDENGPLMLSDKILTIKPFDAAGNHSNDYNKDRLNYGSNLWGTSNMRSWLNSTASEGNVNWLCGNPPTIDKVYEGYNSYAYEKGFLADGNFAESERNAIKSVTQKTILNALDATNLKSGGTELLISDEHTTMDEELDMSLIELVLENYDKAYYQNVTDKMFLLDIRQVYKIYQNSIMLGENYYLGEFTQQAVDNSEFKGRSTSLIGHYTLRCPEQGGLTATRCVSADGIISINGASFGIGIRPAFYINVSSVNLESGNGNTDMPYLVKETNNLSSDGITDGISKIPTDSMEYVSIYENFIQNDLRNWFEKEKKDLFDYSDPIFSEVFMDAYMIDIDNDTKPELFVIFADTYTTSMVFKYQDGNINIVNEVRFLTDGGGSGGSNFSKILKGNDGRIYIYNYNSSRVEYGESNLWRTCEEIQIIKACIFASVYKAEIDENNNYLINGEKVSEAQFEKNEMDANFYTVLLDSRDYGEWMSRRIDANIPKFGSKISKYWDNNSIISVTLNNTKILFDQQPIIKNGRTLVPMRAIFEALGCEIIWNEDKQSILAIREDREITMQIGRAEIHLFDKVNEVNSQVIQLDVAPEIINGRTLVPVRAISEVLNCNVDWDGATNTVIITN